MKEKKEIEADLSKLKQKLKNACETDRIEELQRDIRKMEEIRRILLLNENDFYGILECSRSNTLDEIRASFREKATLIHPSRTRLTGSNSALQNAYAHLNTLAKKIDYDKEDEPIIPPGYDRFNENVSNNEVFYRNPGWGGISASIGIVDWRIQYNFYLNELYNHTVFRQSSRSNTSESRTVQFSRLITSFGLLLIIICLLYQGP
ncbi:hypothetical protein ECANGB1_2779 [Enterospora canceri]|uniref:J domain-containing protein n=1 Tax=Enterospora canceri TaxID=1081671 RepID=A0A1Y1S9E6_9MICR|nr:hypothetical protein ECANGB1_2779 [Enterospora canceri]